MKTKFTFLLLFAFLFIACPGSGPIIDPPDPPIPPIEYVYVDTCVDSLEMRNTYCPYERIGFNKKYVKGTEPLTWCSFHKKPPDPPDPFPPKYETYSINWIGLLPWMVMQEMLGYDVDEDIETLIEKSRRTGASYVHSFCWIGDPGPENSYSQFAIPWLWVDGKVDFTKPNPEYELQFKFLAETCKKYDMEFRPIFFMARYNYYVFRPQYNHQGIRDFYTKEAKVIQKKFISDCIEWLKEVEGQNYKPTVLLINEPDHHGVDEIAHEIANWHEEIGDYVLQWTTPDRLWFDASHSEYVHAYFIEVGPASVCPKCGLQMGRDEFASRPCISESHGSSTLEGFLDNGFDMWAGSAWTHGAFNEDGSGSGSKLCDGIPAFRQANTEEYTIALTYGRDNKKNKRLYIVAFPFDPIQNKRENYFKAFVLTYDWERLNVYSVVNR